MLIGLYGGTFDPCIWVMFTQQECAEVFRVGYSAIGAQCTTCPQGSPWRMR